MLSRVTQCLVNPVNEQQLAQRHLCQRFLSSPTWNRSSWRLWHKEASGCLLLRVSMVVEFRRCCAHLQSSRHRPIWSIRWPCLLCPWKHTHALGTGRVHTRLRVPLPLFPLFRCASCSFPWFTKHWTFGTGKDFIYIPIHEIASALCPQMTKGLLFFHAITGCDVTSYFTNRGKKSGWPTWLA